MLTIEDRKKRVRAWLAFFVLALATSGLTAIPLKFEINILNELAGHGSALARLLPALGSWIDYVYRGLMDAYTNYPFLAYGTDWLAFAHIVLAIAFIGPLRDPANNLWVIEFGMIACVLIIPWTLIFGVWRGIPSFWMLVDMSFGIFGVMPLWVVRREILRIRAAV